MTKAIILPSTRTEALRPLTYQLPVGLLPIVNKPLMEHQVELLVRNGITDIMVNAHQMAGQIEEHLGSGQQWQAFISYNHTGPQFGAIEALRQMSDFHNGATLVVMESDVITDIDLNAVLELHKERRADATFVCPVTTSPSFGHTVALDGSGRVRLVRASSPAAARHLADGGICVLEPELLELLSDKPGYNLLQTCWLASQKVRVNMYGYQFEKPLARVSNWKTFYKVQSDILEGRFPGVVIPGDEIRKGVWVGRNVTTAPDVHFEGPILVGDRCTLGRNSRIGRGTILGNNVVIEEGVVLERSIVLSKTLVGRGSRANDAVVLGNLLINTQQNSCTTLSNSMTLAKVPRQNMFRLYQVANMTVAFGLAAILLPFVLLLACGLLLTGRGPVFCSTRRISVDLGAFARGTLRLRVFDLFYLGGFSKQHHQQHGSDDPSTRLPAMIARVGNLLNVIKGDIMLVGNRPMDPEYAFSITEEWKRTRFKCQAGLIGITDTFDKEVSDDERSVTEGYYAVSRNAGMDAVVVVKAGRRVFSDVIRRITSRRAARSVQQRTH